MSLDPEALAASSAPLPDEVSNNAPANAATTPAPAQPQAEKPAPAAQDAASAPAEPPAGEEKADPDAPPQQPEKPKGGFQRRIAELTRQRYEAERRAQEAEQRLAQAQPAQPSAEFNEPEPDIETFQTLKDYSKALAQWSAKKAAHDLRAENAQASQRQQQEHRQNQAAVAVHTAVETFNAREIDVAEKHADYYQVANSPQMVALRDQRPDVASAVIDSPHGPEIVYFLGKNPAAAAQLANLPPLAAARELGRIEQMFMQPKSQSTKAPPPPNTVGNNSSVEKRPEDMSMDEYRRWRAAGG